MADPETKPTMTDDKDMIVHFHNGSNLQLAFPAQMKNSGAALAEAVKSILSSDKLVVQTEHRLLVIPWGGVKYLETNSLPPSALPFGAIKGATIVTSQQ